MQLKRGFTLIELLVVIAIIGILASIIMVSLTSARAKGRDAKRVADIRTLQLSLEEYYNDNNYYPTALSALAPTYTATLPKDPSDNSSYPYTSYNLTSQGNSLCTSYKPIKYHLAAKMESDSTNNSALNQDTDYANDGTYARCNVTGSIADFNGNAAACLGASAASPDPCYDQTNN